MPLAAAIGENFRGWLSLVGLNHWHAFGHLLIRSTEICNGGAIASLLCGCQGVRHGMRLGQEAFTVPIARFHTGGADERPRKQRLRIYVLSGELG